MPEGNIHVMDIDERYHTRHPATQHALKMLSPNKNLPHELLVVAQECHQMAEVMADALPDGPELTTGLRKLLEAKDCFVRSMVDFLGNARDDS
jgi:hypothetical protein